MENKKVFIGCSSKDFLEQKYFSIAKQVSNLFVENGYDLVFGAASFGMMGECYRTFIENGSDIYSHTVSKYIEDLKKLKSEKEYIHETTFERTKNLYKQADLILFLPGGTGTMAEIFSVLEENRTTDFLKSVILFNYDGYYDKLLDLINHCVQNRFNDKDIFNYFKVVNSMEELISEINKVNNK